MPITFHVATPDPNDPQAVFSPAVIAEFQALMYGLNARRITRWGWDRIKTLLVAATLEANDAETGASAWAISCAKWVESEFYDGQD